MRGKLFLAWIAAGLLLLSGCSRAIRCPSDELRMYSWRSEFDSGNVISLSFEDPNAEFSIENESFSLDIDGLCVFSDDSFVICDDDSDVNYRFGYRLYGDRVELSCDGGTVSLKKQ